MALKGSKTEENLKAAFAGESQANRRYLYFAQKADVEGYNDVSALFLKREKLSGELRRRFQPLDDAPYRRRAFPVSPRRRVVHHRSFQQIV